jgi:hypothetical protein
LERGVLVSADVEPASGRPACAGAAPSEVQERPQGRYGVVPEVRVPRAEETVDGRDGLIGAKRGPGRMIELNVIVAQQSS